MRFGDDWQARLMRLPGPDGVLRLAVTGTLAFDGAPVGVTVAPDREGFDEHLLFLNVTADQDTVPDPGATSVPVDWQSDVGIEYSEVRVRLTGADDAELALPVVATH